MMTKTPSIDTSGMSFDQLVAERTRLFAVAARLSVAEHRAQNIYRSLAGDKPSPGKASLAEMQSAFDVVAESHLAALAQLDGIEKAIMTRRAASPAQLADQLRIVWEALELPMLTDAEGRLTMPDPQLVRDQDGLGAQRLFDLYQAAAEVRP